jgi:hypothetical protein
MITLCLLQATVAVAQQKNVKQKDLRFHSITQAGLLAGSSDGQLLLQTTIGLKYKTYFAGAGVGLDYYQVRSVPVFIDVRKYIFDKPQSPFVYADAGVNFPWARQNEENWNIKYKTGSYFDFGIGYHFPLKKSLALVVSGGYSQKTLSAKEYTMNWFLSSSWPPPGGYIINYDYTFRRFNIKAGLSF